MNSVKIYITDRGKELIQEALKKLDDKALKELMKILEGMGKYYELLKLKLQKQMNFLNKKKTDMMLDVENLENRVGSFLEPANWLLGTPDEIKGFVIALIGDITKRDTSKVMDFTKNMVDKSLEFRKVDLEIVDKMIEFLNSLINIITGIIKEREE